VPNTNSCVLLRLNYWNGVKNVHGKATKHFGLTNDVYQPEFNTTGKSGIGTSTGTDF
jgi:hypothetical protein